jgi:outer membrane lipoprotein carrier protein
MGIFRRGLILVVFFAFLLLSIPAIAADLSLQEKATKLQATYDNTTSFVADFTQITSMKLSRRERQGSGSLLMKKPGLMRWDYQEPDRQVLISDGEKMSMYFAGAEQMIIMPAQEYLQSDVTYAFFAGTGNVLRDFEIGGAGEDFCCGTPPDLRLTPKKPHPQVEFLYIWINDDFLISRMQIADHYGSITDLSFTNITLNQALDSELFQFTPPEGTEIVRK